MPAVGSTADPRSRRRTVYEYRDVVAVAWRAGPGLAAATVGGILCSAAAPLGIMASVSGLVAATPGVIAHGSGSSAGRAALAWSLWAGAFLFLQWIAGTVRGVAASALGERIDAVMQRDLMVAVLAPTSIRHLEDPKTLDLIEVGRETLQSAWAKPGRLVGTLGALAVAWLTLIGAISALARFNPLAALVVFAAGLWVAREERVASRLEASHHYGGTEASRRLQYLYDLGSTPDAAKEVRVFGLSGFLLSSFTSTWRTAMAAVITPVPRRPLMASTTLAVAVLGALAWTVTDAHANHITASAVAVCAQALMLALAGVQQLSWTGLQTEIAMATFRRYDQAYRTLTHPEPGERPETVPTAIRGAHTGTDTSNAPAIVFQKVSFRYSDGPPVLNDLDLTIPAGRSVAIVGANGVGKTTLVKLLCGMYQPDSGRIAVDGEDLAATDIEDWRRRLAVVLQDATQFPLPAAEVIGLGRIEDGTDLPGIEQAARDADIADDIAGLSDGWDTPLSPDLAGGTDLSGGQWQKIALARAMFRVQHGAGVLILDEPAASLDARAEAKLHDRFLSITEGLTAVVISHRFSTVRHASSIVVLDEGRVVEHGTHDELVAMNGRYAYMFALQARRFADSDGPGHAAADREAVRP